MSDIPRSAFVIPRFSALYSERLRMRSYQQEPDRMHGLAWLGLALVARHRCHERKKHSEIF
jgi:hypothetical protein